jgi:hypothetical protein
MSFRDCPDDGEPQPVASTVPRPRRVELRKRLQDARQLMLGNTRARILCQDDSVTFVALNANRRAAAVQNRVLNQVADSAAKFGGTSVHPYRVVCCAWYDAALFCLLRTDRTSEAGKVDPTHGLAGGIAARNLDGVGGQLVYLVNAFNKLLFQFLVLDEFESDTDGRQGAPQIMPDRPQQSPLIGQGAPNAASHVVERANHSADVGGSRLGERLEILFTPDSGRRRTQRAERPCHTIGTPNGKQDHEDAGGRCADHDP